LDGSLKVYDFGELQTKEVMEAVAQ
jgi:hypothetical protein